MAHQHSQAARFTSRNLLASSSLLCHDAINLSAPNRTPVCQQIMNHVLILIRILYSSYGHRQHERLVASLVHHLSEDSNLPIFDDTDDTEEEDASNKRQKKREAEEADKVEVAPG